MSSCICFGKWELLASRNSLIFMKAGRSIMLTWHRLRTEVQMKITSLNKKMIFEEHRDLYYNKELNLNFIIQSFSYYPDL